MKLVGVDGCKGGWICAISDDSSIDGFIAPSFEAILDRVGQSALLGIDVPIGLPDRGPRECDRAARQILKAPRASSVFPAPVRAALSGNTYAEASKLHERADGRRMTRQAFGILHKIREVDALLSKQPTLQKYVREVHPELSFALWNKSTPMKHQKGTLPGRTEREVLIEERWPGWRKELVSQLGGLRYRADDLNDAFAALWTAHRIQSGLGQVIPGVTQVDRFGLKMEMWA